MPRRGSGGVGAAAALHGLMKPLLLAAVALHIAGALAHGFLFQTGVLERMFRPERE